MNSLTFEPVRTPEDIAALADLAREIWFEYYVSLIGHEQVEYMVAKFQSAPAMAAQIAQGYEYFRVQQADRGTIGYAAVQEQADRSLFISKLYLLRDCRGRGTGRQIMAFIEDLAGERGLMGLWLTVNKGNPAVAAYQRLGFHVAEAIVADIGNGFVMDDFRMEKHLPAQR